MKAVALFVSRRRGPVFWLARGFGAGFAGARALARWLAHGLGAGAAGARALARSLIPGLALGVGTGGGRGSPVRACGRVVGNDEGEIEIPFSVSEKPILKKKREKPYKSP